MYVTPEPRGGLKSFLGQTEALGHALMGKISPKVCAAYFTKITPCERVGRNALLGVRGKCPPRRPPKGWGPPKLYIS